MAAPADSGYQFIPIWINLQGNNLNQNTIEHVSRGKGAQSNWLYLQLTTRTLG